MKRNKGIAWLYNELPVLIKQGILSNESAEKVRQYYGDINPKNKAQIALAIFGVVGAVCVGLGIILLFAYNWDDLTRMQRTSLAFAPLLLSNALLCWAIFKNKQSLAIREGFSVFNMLAIGGAIALISQIYHLPGDIDSFLLTWMLLSIPLVYLMSASLPAVLYLIGITAWSAMSQINGGHALLFWPLVALVFPHYLKHLSKDPYASRPIWLSSALCLCFSVAIGISLEKVLPGLWIIVYSAFYCILYLVSKFWFDDAPATWQRPFRNYGILGTTILSYIFTYEWVWKSIGWNYYRIGGKFHAAAGIADYLVAGTLVFIAISLIVKMAKRKELFETSFSIMPILAIICYSFSGFGENEFISVWIYNLYVLYLGIVCVLSGLKEQQLGITNIGILIMGVLIFTRFLDASLGIIERGIIFIIIGACFIIANMFLSKKFERKV
ncbi:MAG: DUF2157 domain-containing protein [Candidatus Omnitrophica bacterium]|nr:DUF2157 domain-containing protein [Candidatus Omnitrophota bacterium]